VHVKANGDRLFRFLDVRRSPPRDAPPYSLQLLPFLSCSAFL